MKGIFPHRNKRGAKKLTPAVHKLRLKILYGINGNFIREGGGKEEKVEYEKG